VYEWRPAEEAAWGDAPHSLDGLHLRPDGLDVRARETGRVDEIQVDVARAEVLERVGDARRDVESVHTGVLGGEEDLVARERAQRLAGFDLVPVDLRRVCTRVSGARREDERRGAHRRG
jgi:hypothetical protein